MKKLIFIIFFWFFIVNIFAQEWLPLEIGNRWQFLRTKTSGTSIPYFTTTYELREIYIERDTIINEQKYFTGYLYHIRYSEDDNKAYIWWNNQDRVYMDFNKSAGDTFHVGSTVYNVIGGTIILFSNYLEFKGYRLRYISQPNNTSVLNEVRFVPQVGWYLFYNSSSNAYYYSSHTDELLMAILYDSSGDSTFLTNHYNVQFNLVPVTLIGTHLFRLNFSANHPFNKQPASNSTGFVFIDTIEMESFYSKNDSIIVNMSLAAGYVSYSNYVSWMSLDTVLMKDGFTFNYRLIAKDKGIIPETSFSPDTGYYQCVWDFSTDVINDENQIAEFSLSQNYPNPFNPTTSIQYAVGSKELVSLKVFDVLGREVAVLINEDKQPGVYEVEFNATGLASGIYYYRLTAGSFYETKKLILMK